MIKNAKITNVDLTMRESYCLTLNLALEGDGWGCLYGGYCLGHGHLGSNHFIGSAKGMEAIMRIMDTVGVESLEELKGKYIRVETNGWGSNISKIGNIIENKWFDYEIFFKEEASD